MFSGILKNTKATTLEQIVNKVIEPLLKSNFNKKNFKVFLSDGAAYYRKLGDILKENFNCLHVICVCHNIHNFSEYLRKKYKKDDDLISFLKRILIKNKDNNERWEKMTKLSLPKFPILTRWGTWISCSVFIYKNFDKIKRFLISIKNK